MERFPPRRAAVGTVAAIALAGIIAAAPMPRSSIVPCDQNNAGLTLPPDGSVYVSDDVAGTIYKISYKGT